MTSRFKWAALPLLLLAGCNASHLAYVHNANLGIDVSMSPEQGTTRLSVGYDRETFALVPRYAKDAVKVAEERLASKTVTGKSTEELKKITPGSDEFKSLHEDVQTAVAQYRAALEMEAMSLTAISRVHLEGLSVIEFSHVIATGKPAIWVAKDGEGLKDVADRIFVEKPAETKAKAKADTEAAAKPASGGTNQ